MSSLERLILKPRPLRLFSSLGGNNKNKKGIMAFPGYMLRSGISGLHGSSIFSFFKTTRSWGGVGGSFPGSPVVKTLPSNAGVQVLSLVEELKFLCLLWTKSKT